jgi:hypothetical protein
MIVQYLWVYTSGANSGASFTGSVLSRNVRRNKKIVAGDKGDKHSSLFFSDEEKSYVIFPPYINILKLFTIFH